VLPVVLQDLVLVGIVHHRLEHETVVVVAESEELKEMQSGVLAVVKGGIINVRQTGMLGVNKRKIIMLVEEVEVMQEVVETGKDSQDPRARATTEIQEIVTVVATRHHAATTEIQVVPEEIGGSQEMVEVPVPQLVRGMLGFSTAHQTHLKVEKSIIDVL